MRPRSLHDRSPPETGTPGATGIGGAFRARALAFSVFWLRKQNLGKTAGRKGGEDLLAILLVRLSHRLPPGSGPT